MKTRLWILLFALALAPQISFADQCIASDNSCEYYTCMEEKSNCGADGYWLKFGAHYCQKFLDKEKTFSSVGQRWLQMVRQCLQERADDVSRQVSCSRIEREAMDSHISCYIDTGFCNLPKRDMLKVYWHIKSTLNSALAWREAFIINKACAFKR